jgi:hypothetical protein
VVRSASILAQHTAVVSCAATANSLCGDALEIALNP